MKSDDVNRMIEEKQKPFGWVHMNNGRWEDFFLYEDGVGECEDCEYCIPLYTRPVYASDMSQERVDETAKYRHEPWVKTYCGGKPNYTTPEDETPPCKTHPDAPHGFDRNASHSADRYVCECEGWEPPEAKEST